MYIIELSPGKYYGEEKCNMYREAPVYRDTVTDIEGAKEYFFGLNAQMKANKLGGKVRRK